MGESKHTPIPAILDPTPEMLDAFQGGFAEQLHLRHQCRFKQPHQLSDRQRESAEQAGLRSMLATMPADRSCLIAAAPDLLAALKALLIANDAVQTVLCDGPDVPGFDPSALGKAQAKVTEAEAAARTILAKAEGRS